MSTDVPPLDDLERMSFIFGALVRMSEAWYSTVGELDHEAEATEDMEAITEFTTAFITVQHHFVNRVADLYRETTGAVPGPLQAQVDKMNRLQEEL